LGWFGFQRLVFSWVGQFADTAAFIGESSWSK